MSRPRVSVRISMTVDRHSDAHHNETRSEEPRLDTLNFSLSCEVIRLNTLDLHSQIHRLNSPPSLFQDDHMYILRTGIFPHTRPARMDDAFRHAAANRFDDYDLDPYLTQRINTAHRLSAKAKAFLGSLPIHPLNDLPKDDRDCPICIETYSRLGEHPVRLPCGHLMGKTCLFKWLNSSVVNANRNACPTCRADLFERDDWRNAARNEGLDGDVMPELGTLSPEPAFRDELARLRVAIDEYSRAPGHERPYSQYVRFSNALMAIMETADYTAIPEVMSLHEDLNAAQYSRTANRLGVTRERELDDAALRATRASHRAREEDAELLRQIRERNEQFGRRTASAREELSHVTAPAAGAANPVIWSPGDWAPLGYDRQPDWMRRRSPPSSAATAAGRTSTEEATNSVRPPRPYREHAGQFTIRRPPPRVVTQSGRIFTQEEANRIRPLQSRDGRFEPLDPRYGRPGSGSARAETGVYPPGYIPGLGGSNDDLRQLRASRQDRERRRMAELMAELSGADAEVEGL